MVYGAIDVKRCCFNFLLLLLVGENQCESVMDPMGVVRLGFGARRRVIVFHPDR